MIDFEITANRPDCLNHVGIAREASVIWQAPLKAPAAASAAPAGDIAVDVELAEPALCPRYCAQVFDVAHRAVAGLARRAPRSRRRPADQQHRRRHQLRDARDGPADARLRSRRGCAVAGWSSVAPRAGETLQTLDGVQRTLDPEMLVIADAERASAVAGVMGGRDSEIHGATTRMVLESAYFNPPSVRRTQQAPRTEDRSLDAVRARRRRQRAARRDRARGGAVRNRSAPDARVGPLVDRYPARPSRAATRAAHRSHRAPAGSVRSGRRSVPALLAAARLHARRGAATAGRSRCRAIASTCRAKPT